MSKWRSPRAMAGFEPPSPFPHQIQSGAMAAEEGRRVRGESAALAEVDKERKREREEIAERERAEREAERWDGGGVMLSAEDRKRIEEMRESKRRRKEERKERRKKEGRKEDQIRGRTDGDVDEQWTGCTTQGMNDKD